MLFSVLIRKGKVPRHNFNLPRSQSWLRGGISQLAAPSGPGSHVLPSWHPWGSLTSNPAGPQSPQVAQMGRPDPPDCAQADTTARGSQRQGWGRGALLLRAGARASGGPLWGLPVLIPSLFPRPPSSLLAWGWVGWRASRRRRPGSASYLTSIWWPPHHRPLTQSLLQCSLADCYQWAGPIAALTRSWEGNWRCSLTVVACGQGLLRDLSRC